jgi:hypothetical protein
LSLPAFWYMAFLLPSKTHSPFKIVGHIRSLWFILCVFPPVVRGY